VVRVLGGGISLNRGDVGDGLGVHDVQLNLVDTSLQCLRAFSEISLTSSRRNRQPKVDGVAISDRDTLNGSDVLGAKETSRCGIGNLAHELTADVGGGVL